jgi:hypothetical protein
MIWVTYIRYQKSRREPFTKITAPNRIRKLTIAELFVAALDNWLHCFLMSHFSFSMARKTSASCQIERHSIKFTMCALIQQNFAYMWWKGRASFECRAFVIATFRRKMSYASDYLKCRHNRSCNTEFMTKKRTAEKAYLICAALGISNFEISALYYTLYNFYTLVASYEIGQKLK